MYKSKTTFVIGAGASLELGFPTSHTLKGQIATAVNIKYEYSSRQVSGDPAVAEALRRVYDFHKTTEIEEYNLHLRAGWHISDAMPQAISIDNFIENQEDPRVTLMAKLGIASCLIDDEKLCLKKYRSSENNEEINWHKFQDNWIHSFFQTLTEGTRKSEIKSIFQNLKFVIFNYDRSFEFFLAKCLAKYYGIPAHDAEAIVSGATFIHPYGQVGALEWQTSNLPTVRFGSGIKNDLASISQSILTFSEQLEDAERLEALRDSINGADQIVFLGFAFHDSNMLLLQPDRTRNTTRVVATAFGVSKPDCDVILGLLETLCLTPGNGSMIMHRVGQIEKLTKRTENFVLDSGATCKSLFETYRRTIIS